MTKLTDFQVALVTDVLRRAAERFSADADAMYRANLLQLRDQFRLQMQEAVRLADEIADASAVVLERSES